MNKNEAIGAYRFLRGAKLSKMDTTDKFKIIRLLGKLRTVETEFNDFLRDVRERMTSDDDENVYRECISKELSKSVDIEYDRLSEDAFGRLMDSNPDWVASDVVVLSEILM